jgi:hypothetical protein
LEGGNYAADVLKVQLSEPVCDGSVLLKAKPSGGKSVVSHSPSADIKGQQDASTNNGQLLIQVVWLLRRRASQGFLPMNSTGRARRLLLRCARQGLLLTSSTGQLQKCC